MLVASQWHWQEAVMMMVRKSKGITDKHIKVLEFVNEYQNRFGRPPSIREIGEKVKISSTSVVNYYLEQLEKMGYLERDNRVSRGMRLTGKVNQIVQAGNMLRVPILGPIAAGMPLPELQPGVSYMTDSEAEAVDIARSLLPPKEKGDNLYALEVKGNSMIDAMINDGDIVVMKPATDARNGEMVAVWLPSDNEATLKYFFKERDRYRLQPANPTMKPIFIKKTEPLEIKGKVVMVIRKMDKPLAA
ncbi:repressor LexA [Chloroflexi bacterium CFX6]|nr:repressor LexA [Chloroflexi bacterium CFX6]